MLRGPVLLAACVAALVCVASASAVTAKTTRVSVNSSEQPANNSSGSYGTISMTGRFVVFDSLATNLVPSDTNTFSDVFIRDRKSGITRRVSLDSAEGEGNNGSYEPSVSSDGRFVAFESYASDLTVSDTNGAEDIFLRDRKKGLTRRVSVSSAGAEATGPPGFSSLHSAISANGRFITFQSFADNLVPNDTNNLSDVFVYDRIGKTTRRVDVTSAGGQSPLGADTPSISADGRFVAFETPAPLASADTNTTYDVYVRDRKLKRTRLVSVRSNGAPANQECLNPIISENGRFVAFNSTASNLVRHDTGGHSDAFVHDRKTGKTYRASVNARGHGGNSESYDPASVSNNGKFILFDSTSTNLAPNDNTPGSDVFLRNLLTGKTRLVSVSRSGHAGNDDSFIYFRSLTADGRWASFESSASNLVPNDSAGAYDDVFVRGPLH